MSAPAAPPAETAAPLPLGSAEIRAAAARLRGHAVVTPLLEAPLLNEALGLRLLFKAEPLQRTGSFKFRGAYNNVSQQDTPAVVAYSSGNHAQGVAAAAAMLGKPATIIMPADAPAMKIANTRAYGAEIRLYDRYHEVREKIGAELARATGAAVIKPYDDPLTIAGQGTAGLEIAEQCQARGITPDRALICCGGGGLLAGCALALRDAFPDLALYSAEPDGFDDTARSLDAGERLAHDGTVRSICDAILTPIPGAVTFPINRALVRGGLRADDGWVLRAMRTAWQYLKLVVEPGGAIALACSLKHARDWQGETVVVMLSGGNVDGDMFARCLRQAEPRA